MIEIYSWVMELKNFQMGISEIASDLREYMAKSRKITMSTFKTNFLMKIWDRDDVCSAERKRLIQIWKVLSRHLLTRWLSVPSAYEIDLNTW
jgi:hypothetical protein